jgi:hypothetical protein
MVQVEISTVSEDEEERQQAAGCRSTLLMLQMAARLDAWEGDDNRGRAFATTSSGRLGQSLQLFQCLNRAIQRFSSLAEKYQFFLGHDLLSETRALSCPSRVGRQKFRFCSEFGTTTPMQL